MKVVSFNSCLKGSEFLGIEPLRKFKKGSSINFMYMYEANMLVICTEGMELEKVILPEIEDKITFSYIRSLTPQELDAHNRQKGLDLTFSFELEKTLTEKLSALPESLQSYADVTFIRSPTTGTKFNIKTVCEVTKEHPGMDYVFRRLIFYAGFDAVIIPIAVIRDCWRFLHRQYKGKSLPPCIQLFMEWLNVLQMHQAQICIHSQASEYFYQKFEEQRKQAMYRIARQEYSDRIRKQAELDEDEEWG